MLNMTRRSTRVRVSIPLTVTSLDPALRFSETCQTVVVNAHGCALRASQPLEYGTRIRLKLATGVETPARVVVAQPLGDGRASWILGVELEEPGNFWGLHPCPKDWMQHEATAVSGKPGQVSTPAALNLKMPVWPLAAPAARKRPPAGPSGRDPRQEIAAAVTACKADVAESLNALPQMVRQQLLQLQEPALAHLAKCGDRLQPLQAELAKHRQELETLRQAAAGNAAVATQMVPPQWKQEIAAHAREHAAIAAGEKLRPVRDELARQQQHWAELDATVAAQLEGLGSLVEQHTESKFGALRENLRADLQQAINAVRSKLVESLRTQISQEMQHEAERQTAHLRQVADEACSRIDRLHHDVEEAMGASLCQQSTELLATFQREISQISQQAIEQWRSAWPPTWNRSLPFFLSSLHPKRNRAESG